MKKLSLTWGLLLVLTLCATSHQLYAVQFLRLSLAEAKIRAAQLQRPLFLHFSANWCLPCQWMEQNTFIDPNLTAYLNDNYVAVKIDVDEVQGFADKESCGVKFLPTMLVFNAAGIVVARYEETLDPIQLQEHLCRYNTLENRVATLPLRPNSAAMTTIPVQYVGLSQESTPNLSAGLLDDPAQLDAQRRMVSQSSRTSSPTMRKMGVQVGIYSSYEHVVRQVQFFEKRFNTAVNIFSQPYNGQTHYHLIAGPFETAAQMQTYLNALQRVGVKGLVILL